LRASAMDSELHTLPFVVRQLATPQHAAHVKAVAHRIMQGQGGNARARLSAGLLI